MNRYQASHIRSARKQLGWTQAKLAQMSGFERGAVIYWEKRSGLIGGVAVDAFIKAFTDSGIVVEPAQTPTHRLVPDTRSLLFTALPELQPKPPKSKCGAKTRRGTPCQCKPVPGKERCKYHGGMSTGARTPEGIERIRQAQIERWNRYRAKQAA